MLPPGRDLSIPTLVVLRAYARMKRVFPSVVHPDNPWFRSAYFAYKYWYEDPYAGLLRRVRPGPGHFLDVGANIGYSSWLFSRTIDPRFRIYAFEPERANFRSLSRLAERIPVILPVRAAVGSERGTVPLWVNPDHHGDHRVLTADLERPASEEIQAVPQVSVDEFLEEKGIAPSQVSFVKIDVQGAEPRVFEGMKRLLKANPKVMVAFEVDPWALRQAGVDVPGFLSRVGSAPGRVRAVDRRGRLSEVPASPGERLWNGLLLPGAG